MMKAKTRSHDRSKSNKSETELRRLARLYRVQTFYHDVAGRRQEASAESLLSVLRALGAPVDRISHVSYALKERRHSMWNRPLEPVTVAWDGNAATFKLRLPENHTGKKMAMHLYLETGEEKSWTLDPKSSQTIESAEINGTSYALHELKLQDSLPIGYHRLTLESGDTVHESKIISAPIKAYSGGAESKIWGCFLPIYALHSRKSWGAGDFADFEALHDWLAELGGEMFATLPFLAAFLDKPCEPSPYSPASRLFWNEFFLDLNRIPELKECQTAQRLIASMESTELEALRSSPLVDYRLQMELKRRVIEELSNCFFEAQEKNPSFLKFVQSRPEVEDYARFRATGEKLGLPWQQWPQRLREGALISEDYDQRAKRYHIYAQWLAHEQIHALAAKARELGPGLYLDLPLGVHPFAYDVWRRRSLFPDNISGGAPPDIIFTKGQNWGFPPLHPEKIREEGYEYVIDFLSHIMRQAGMLRIDHVMGLHRLYWIPGELDATKGVYVRYPADELYAILALESHRNRCRIVGENLGTVPGYVNEALSRHNILKMYVVQYELESKHPRVLRTIPANCTASLNTHDMPPFAGFWQGVDIEDRQGIGLLDNSGVQSEREGREKTKKNFSRFLERKGRLKKPPSEGSVLRASIAHLAASAARIVLVNLEDLWLETRAQNLPGTSGERPNWRSKARFALEEIVKSPQVADALKEVDRLRKDSKTKGS